MKFLARRVVSHSNNVFNLTASLTPLEGVESRLEMIVGALTSAEVTGSRWCLGQGPLTEEGGQSLALFMTHLISQNGSSWRFTSSDFSDPPNGTFSAIFNNREEVLHNAINI